MSVDKKYELITRNLQEVLGEDVLKKIIEKRPLSIYWGTAITGKPHIAYFLPILKIKDFADAGCKVKVLFADIHGFLDNLKTPLNKVQQRTVYYEKIIRAMLTSLGVDLKNIEFIKGSDYQRSEDYILDLYKIMSLTTEHDAKKAGSQVVKQVENPMVGSIVYPMMQALDEEYLKVDAQFGGVDQRKIFTYARKYLPMLGYKKRIHLMNPMLPGLNSDKMSSSDELSKIDLMDSKKTIAKKLNKCFCEEGNKETGILVLFAHIIFPVYKSQDKKIEIIDRDGNRTFYECYEDLEAAFCNKLIHPGDLKSNSARMIDEIVAPVRNDMEADMEMVKLAYK